MYKVPTSLSEHMYLHIQTPKRVIPAHIYIALYSRVQFGQRKSSQHLCFSGNDTK